MSKKVLVKVRLGKTGDVTNTVKANDHSVYQVEDAGKQLEFLKVTRSHNDLLISNKRTGESLLLKDYYEQSDVAVIVQGEGDKAGLWMLDSNATLAGATDLGSVLIPAPESSGAFWGGMDWPLLEVLVPAGIGVGLSFAGGESNDRVILSTPSAVLSKDSGANSADGLTNVANLNISALQEGATRTYSINGGPESANYTAPTTDGVYTVVVTDRMADGQTTSTTVKFTLDKTIATPTVALATDSGISATDAVTQDGSVVVGGTPAADVVRTYSINGGAASSSYVAPTVDGTYTVTVTDTDAAGNTASASTSFTLDKTIATPTVALVTDSGTSSTDGLTNNAALAVSAAAADVTRTYSINGGATSSSYVAPTVDGTYTVTVTDTDAAGNTASASTNFTLDKTIATPTVALATDSGISATDAVTQDGSVVVGGTPAADVVRTYSINGGAASSSYVAPTVDGTYTVTVTDTDAAGNTASASTSFTLDKTIATPTVALVTDSGTSSTDGLTNNAALAVSAAAADVTRTYSINGGATSSSYVAPTVDGTYTVTITDTDAAGNTASASTTFTLDVTAPSASLSLHLSSDTGSSATDLITNNGQAVLDGYEAIENVRWSVNGSAWMTLDAFNTYAATLADGTYIVKAIESDTAGNMTPEASITYTLDRAIAKPTLAFDPNSAIAADMLTTFPTLTEQIPTDIAVRTYTLFNDATQTTIETTGSFSMPTTAGFYELITTYTDVAGNQASSAPFAFYLGNGAVNTATDTNVASTIVGGAGDDALYGNGGVDLIYGGPDYDDIYINTDNLNQLLNGQGMVNGGAQTDALHIQDVVPKFSLDSLVNVVKGIEIIQFDQSSPVGGLNVSAAAVQAIADINGIGQSSNFISTVLDPAKHQMAFGASSGGGVTLDVGNAAEWVNVGTALYDNTAVMNVYNHLTLPVQIIL